jgi:glycosyltransferase involved in cell wall biosynthesis
MVGRSGPTTYPERTSSPTSVAQLDLPRPSFDGSSVKLSILMPVYNEESTVLRAVAEILGANYPCEIELIVVDDGSTDRTAILLSQVHDDRLIVHRHSVNKGKGAALRSAASFATGTHILPFDADLEYVADDIPRMLEPVLKGRCSVVYGTRLFGCNTVYQSFRHAMGNRLLTFFANIIFDANLSDLHTCLKLMPLAVLKEPQLQELGFGLDTEVTALLLRQGVRPFEVPVSYYSRSHSQGKKITWRDAVKCICILLRVRFWNRSSRGVTIEIDRSKVQYDTAVENPSPSGVSASLLTRLGPESSPPWNQSSDYHPATVRADDNQIVRT